MQASSRAREKVIYQNHFTKHSFSCGLKWRMMGSDISVKRNFLWRKIMSFPADAAVTKRASLTLSLRNAENSFSISDN